MRLDIVIVLIGVATIALGLLGCHGEDDGPDVTAPVMTIVHSTPQLPVAEVCGSMSERVLAVELDGSIQLRIRYTDDAGLAQAKFDLHSNFDCHGHGKLEDQTVWQLLEIVELEGNEKELERTFTPPANVRPGNYHLGLTCVDAAGNEATPIYFDVRVIDLQDTVPPVITLHSPTAGGTYARSEPFVISGVAVDNLDMGLGEVTVTVLDGAGNEHNAIRSGFGADVGASAGFSFDFQLPQSFVAGQCTVILEVTDWRNNPSTLSRGFMMVE